MDSLPAWSPKKDWRLPGDHLRPVRHLAWHLRGCRKRLQQDLQRLQQRPPDADHQQQRCWRWHHRLLLRLFSDRLRLSVGWDGLHERHVHKCPSDWWNRYGCQGHHHRGVEWRLGCVHHHQRQRLLGGRRPLGCCGIHWQRRGYLRHDLAAAWLPTARLRAAPCTPMGLTSACP